MQCLDALRAMARSPAAVDAYCAEVGLAAGGNASLDRHLSALRADLSGGRDHEFRARDLVDRMAVGLQAALLVRHAPAWLADAFCRSRLDGVGHHQYGTLPERGACTRIIERALPS